MGQFTVKVVLRGEKGIKEIPLLVDTGATYSLVTEEDARNVGIMRSRHKAEIDSGRGQPKRRAPLGLAAMTFKNRTGGVIVVVDGDRLLGAQGLEALGLRVDPVKQELVLVEGLTPRVRITTDAIDRGPENAHTWFHPCPGNLDPCSGQTFRFVSDHPRPGPQHLEHRKLPEIPPLQ